MPDIRSFFGPKNGQGQAAPKAAPAKKETPNTRKRRNVVSDDEEEDEEPAKPKKVTPKAAQKQAPKEEAVETSSYFASGGKNKISRSAAPAAAAKPKSTKTRTRKPKEEGDDVNYIDDDDEDYGDDIFKAEYGKEEDEYVESAKPSQVKDEDEEMLDDGDDDDDVQIVETRTRSTRSGRASTNLKKRKSPESDDEDDFVEDDDDDKKPPPRKKAATAKSTPAKKPAAKKPKEEAVENDAMKKIFDAIPTVRPPTPPDRDEGKKFNFRDFKQRGDIAPPNAGSKDIPEGQENCLAGLTFVFTGVLQSLERDVGIELVKRYGGKVTGAPSTKTSYVVLGDQAGPKKLETIRKYNLKTINEDGLFKLIETLPANGGSGVNAQVVAKKKAEEEQKIIEAAKEMTISSPTKGSFGHEIDPNAQLWTVKYAPSQMKEICGNKGQVEKLQAWLKAWPRSLKMKFKMPGKDGSGTYRAVMIHGPPGIGKTTAAHLVAKLEGYDVLEYNASDTRSKKLLDESLRGVLDNRSLMGFFAGDKKKVDENKKKLVLVMDEVDGMSAGDRGGVGQLAALIKKSSIPIICICNDRKTPKMKPFDHVTYDLAFRRPDANAVRARMASIAYKEGLKIPGNVIDKLTEGTHSDIRQIINMLSTYRVSAKDMSFDDGKAMSAAWEKHVILKPWDIAQKLLIGGMFAPGSTKRLNDKIELYFNDHEFSYLMIQENYLKTNPQLAQGYAGREATLQRLKLADEAAQSISDGDLVDALIHGPQQHWSMMPTHAVFSTVFPASRMAGGYSGHQMGFTTWLGNNSKFTKLVRFVKEIQSHMRLQSSANRHEVRQHYIPLFFTLLAKRLETEGKAAVKDMIDLMDSYYLTKDDYDAILELGLGPNDGEKLDIPSVNKAAFTREYNAASHPMSFMKASTVFAPKAAKRDKPDLEEAIEESEDEMAMLDAAKGEEEEDDMDVTKDKYVKQPKKKAAPKKAAGAAKGKAKTKAAEDFIDDDDDDDSDDKPKAKGRAAASKGKAAAKGKAKGKR